MNVSMVICTYNRLGLLKETIKSLLAQTVCQRMDISWEIIVVDNNCTDGTADYVKQLAENNPKVVYILETKQGLGHARNAGAEAARHEIIAYIDDDEWADPSWAEEIVRVYRENENVGCVGGPYFLEKKEQIPFWIAPRMYGILGDVWLQTGHKDYFEVGRTTIGGGNFSISKEAYKKTGGFMGEMGRSGNVLLADEDRHMCHAIYDTGFRLFYNPKAIVHHALIPSRLTLAYFRRNVKGMAYSRAEKKKLLTYICELLWQAVTFPVKTLLSPRNGLHYLMRVYSAAYKLRAAWSK